MRSGIAKPTTRITQPAATRLLTPTIRPWRPGTWPKYSAVAQPSSNDAPRLRACQARRRTNGKNGTFANQAIDVPARVTESVPELQGADRHHIVDTALPLLARRVAVQLDLVAVRVHRVQALRHAVVGGALEQPALGEDRVGRSHRIEVRELDRDVVEADGGGHRGRGGVADAQQCEVVMVLPGRSQEDHHVAHLAGHPEAEDVAVEGQRPVEVADLEHDVTDPNGLEHGPMLPQGLAHPCAQRREVRANRAWRGRLATARSHGPPGVAPRR